MYDSIKQSWELIEKLEKQGFRKMDIITILHKVTRDYEDNKTELNKRDDYTQKNNLELQLDPITELLKEYLHLLGSCDYAPYKEKQTKIAIRALLNIRGLKK